MPLNSGTEIAGSRVVCVLDWHGAHPPRLPRLPRLRVLAVLGGKLCGGAASRPKTKTGLRARDDPQRRNDARNGMAETGRPGRAGRTGLGLGVDSLGDKVLLWPGGGRVEVERPADDLLDDARVQVDARAELGVSSAAHAGIHWVRGAYEDRGG